MDDTRYAQELGRIINEYHRRSNTPSLVQRYQQEHADIRLNEKGLQRALRKTFVRHGLASLSGKRILDVGCGNGGWLRRLIESYGAESERCTGIDLMEERIAAARSSLPLVKWHIGSAHALPLASSTYDLMLSFTVFSSILDDALCAAIAQEMWRVLAPGGFILWYDYTYNNPSNRAVRAMPRSRVRAFFPEGTIGDVQRITLAPPLARRIAPHAYWLAAALERGKALNTHLLMTIEKRA
jgi:ubiquinone/menaquinone biosynthesis C-methylase UbiE